MRAPRRRTGRPAGRPRRDRAQPLRCRPPNERLSTPATSRSHPAGPPAERRHWRGVAPAPLRRRARRQGVDRAHRRTGVVRHVRRGGDAVDEQPQFGMGEPAGTEQDTCGQRAAPAQNGAACTQPPRQLARARYRGRRSRPVRVVHEQPQLVAQPQTLHRRRRGLRIGLQSPLDLDPVGHVELPINEGLEFGVVHRLDHHRLTTRSAGRSRAAASPCPTARRRASRARASRDISVPMGRFRISAASR